MRILFVALAESIHTARHIKQLENQGWDIHLFPSIDNGVICSELENVTVYPSFFARGSDLHGSVTTKGINIRFPIQNARRLGLRRAIASTARTYLQLSRPNYRTMNLVKLIKKLKPDIVHSLEFQYAGYMTLAAREIIGDKDFPTWMVQNWGNDIYLYGRVAEHKPLIQKILEQCDFYWCECSRDVQLAIDRGLDPKKVLGVLPNAGGIHLDQFDQQRSGIPTSKRRQILLKAYQHWSGRALVGLQAIRLCADVLHDYTIMLYSTFPDVKLAAELVRDETGLQIEYLPHVSHAEMLRVYSESRVYMGISISDGFSTSMVEAMAMGAFPIQTGTACANEWYTDGVSGAIVPPEDPYVIADALRRAVIDDALVDHAAELNRKTCETHLDYRVVQPKVIEAYRQVMATL